GPEDRQVVGRVVDRGSPDLAQSEMAGQWHEISKPRPITVIRAPVDLAGLPGFFVRIAPAEEQPALLESPVQPGPDVEHHRHTVDVERLVWFQHADRVPPRADRDAQTTRGADHAEHGA